MASQLAYVVLKAFSSESINELSTKRHKFNHNLNHPDVTYARTMSSITEFLASMPLVPVAESPSTEEENTSTVTRATNITSTSTSSTTITTPNSTLTSGNRVTMRTISAGKVLLLGPRVPEGFKINYAEIEADRRRKEQERLEREEYVAPSSAVPTNFFKIGGGSSSVAGSTSAVSKATSSSSHTKSSDINGGRSSGAIPQQTSGTSVSRGLAAAAATTPEAHAQAQEVAPKTLSEMIKQLKATKKKQPFGTTRSATLNTAVPTLASPITISTMNDDNSRDSCGPLSSPTRSRKGQFSVGCGDDTHSTFGGSKTSFTRASTATSNAREVGEPNMEKVIAEYWALPAWGRPAYLAMKPIRDNKKGFGIRKLSKYVAAASQSSSSNKSNGKRTQGTLSGTRTSLSASSPIASRSLRTGQLATTDLIGTTETLSPDIQLNDSSMSMWDLRSGLLLAMEAIGLPRHLDPSEGLYWLADQVLTCLVSLSSQVDAVIWKSEDVVHKNTRKQYKSIRKIIEQSGKPAACLPGNWRELVGPTVAAKDADIDSVSVFVKRKFGIRLGIKKDKTEPVGNNLVARLRMAEKAAESERAVESLSSCRKAEPPMFPTLAETRQSFSRNSSSRGGDGRIGTGSRRSDAAVTTAVAAMDIWADCQSADNHVSPVWAREPVDTIKQVPKGKYRLGDTTDGQTGFAAIANGKNLDGTDIDESERQKEARRYAMDIHKKQSEIRRAEERRLQRLKDQQEMEVGRLRTHSSMMSRLEKQKAEELQRQSLELKAAAEEILKEQAKEARMQRRLQVLEKAQAEEQERERIRAIKQREFVQLDRERRDREERVFIEKFRMQQLDTKEELAMNLRMRQEEARMQYLESLQQKREAKALEAERQKKLEQVLRNKEFLAEKMKFEARIRLGNFMFHQGALGFYDAVREKDGGWIQYEDAAGTPYYYDTVSKKTQYDRPPPNEEVTHYIEVERREYDAIHGNGAYDLFVADRRKKDGINKDGGYYDEDGEWVAVHGYYDDNYEFVDLTKGHFDINGEWVSYEDLGSDMFDTS